ncbi:MAG: hypothetical protein LBE17_12175 [Treponema sp.]|jgi:hypothetical protein|nr:hypothetical protein [Treponema sp.]
MMKKKLALVLITGLAVAILGCASTSDSVPTESSPVQGLRGVPQFVNDAYLKASEDVLIGIGTYKIGNDPAKISTGKPFAETRARADISRQLQTIIKNMIVDYTAQSELDPQASLSFQESITQSLSKSELRGAKVVQAQTDGNGLLWIVMEYSKSAALSDESVNQSVAAAKLAVPVAAAFDALSRMENSFDKVAGGGPIPVGD